MSIEVLVAISEEAILNQLNEVTGKVQVTTVKGVTHNVRAVIDGEIYVSVVGSEGVYKLNPRALPVDNFVAQHANRKLTKGLVKKDSTVTVHNGVVYQVVVDDKGRQYRPLTDKTNIVG